MPTKGTPAREKPLKETPEPRAAPLEAAPVASTISLGWGAVTKSFPHWLAMAFVTSVLVAAAGMSCRMTAQAASVQSLQVTFLGIEIVSVPLMTPCAVEMMLLMLNEPMASCRSSRTSVTQRVLLEDLVSLRHATLRIVG